MRYKHVGLIGKARSGKDSVAQRLVKGRAYTRVALADPLKAMVMQTNPLVQTSPGVVVRLATLINDVGWEYAKDRYPEVRRLLQATGAAVRLHDEDFWLRLTLKKVDAADAWNMPVVITDVRYENEAFALRQRGFALIRVTRPGAGAGENAQHKSETALDYVNPDLTIGNTGTLDDLNRIVDSLLLPRS